MNPSAPLNASRTTSGGPLVSVVTPFYNNAEYLAECIESVLHQRYEPFELVLVDNHSTDGSGDIARRFAERDTRIRLFVPPRFLPQVENYNFALEQASSGAAYVKIVAGDDWLFPNCLSRMVDVGEEHPSVGIVSSYRLRGLTVEGGGLPAGQTFETGREVCRKTLLDGAFMFGSPTTLMYRADLLRERKPFFALGRLHEDTEAAYEILNRRDFGFVHEVLSYSRQQLESEMGSRRGFVPEALDRFIIVTMFGATYLSPRELQPIAKHATRWLYSTLAQAWLADRLGPGAPPGLWDYYRNGLATLGEEIRPELLARAVARVSAKKLLSPRRSGQA